MKFFTDSCGLQVCISFNEALLGLVFFLDFLTLEHCFGFLLVVAAQLISGF